MLGNFPIGHAFSDRTNHLLFAFAKQGPAAEIDQLRRQRASQRFKHHAELITAGPDLTSVHTANALFERIQGFTPREYAVGTRPKCLEYQLRPVMFKQKNYLRLRKQQTQLTYDVRALPGFFRRSRVDYSHVRPVLRQRSGHLFAISVNGVEGSILA